MSHTSQTLTSKLSMVILFSALAHLWCENIGPWYGIFLFKPLTMVLIIWLAAQAESRVSPHYKRMIVIGLIFSLGGDILLIGKASELMFLLGLGSFLIAHLFYIAAFIPDASPLQPSGWNFPLLLYGFSIGMIVYPRLGGMTIPVVIYMAVIFFMAYQATNRCEFSDKEGRALAFIAAVLFVFSDSCIAINRFYAPFESANLWIMSTYFLAQYLFARSI